MRQLLTLNEQIEELKWQRKLKGYCRSSDFSISSCNVESSAYTLGSDVDCAASRDVYYKYPSPSKLSLLEECFSAESLSVEVPPPTADSHSSHSVIDTTPRASRTDFSQGSSRQRKDTPRSHGSTSDLGSYEELTHSTSDVMTCVWKGTDSAYSTCDDARCKEGVSKMRAASEEDKCETCENCETCDNCETCEKCENCDSDTLDSKRDSKGQQSFDSGIQESTA